ncbi:MAG: hypothetical protein ACTSRZ_17440 [Promethearchaeota archaeon]
MEKPKNIQMIINEILDYKPFIKDHLKQNIINYSELARSLLEEIKTDYNRSPNLNAVIMAISRYSEKLKKTQLTKELLKVVAEFDLNLANDMVSITLRRNLSNHSLLSDVYDKNIDWVKGERMYLFQSSGEIAVLLNRKNAKYILEKLRNKSEILHKEDDLSILIVNTPPRMVDIPGVMYYLTGLVARGGITLIDIVSTFTEIIFAVRSEDGTKIFDILQKAIKDSRKKIK